MCSSKQKILPADLSPWSALLVGRQHRRSQTRHIYISDSNTKVIYYPIPGTLKHQPGSPDDIASVKPTIFQGLLCGLGVVQVTSHHLDFIIYLRTLRPTEPKWLLQTIEYLHLWAPDQKFTSFTKFNILPCLSAHNPCLCDANKEMNKEARPVLMESAALLNQQLLHRP